MKWSIIGITVLLYVENTFSLTSLPTTPDPTTAYHLVQTTIPLLLGNHWVSQWVSPVTTPYWPFSTWQPEWHMCSVSQMVLITPGSEGVPSPLEWNDVLTSYRSLMPWPLTASSASAPTAPHTDSSCFTCSLPCTPSTHLALHQVAAPTLHAGLCLPLTPLCHNVTHTPSL